MRARFADLADASPVLHSGAGGARLRWSQIPVENQPAALETLAGLAAEAMTRPSIILAARQITQHVPARDAVGELNAIYEAVKNGTPAVRGLENGVRYINDPKGFDLYMEPPRLLDWCTKGACAEDCDGQASLVAALAGAIGFSVGVRMLRPAGSTTFTHVYAVANDNKEPQGGEGRIWAMDTIVPDGDLGWEAPGDYEDRWIT